MLSLLKFLSPGIRPSGIALIYPNASDDVMCEEAARYCTVYSGHQNLGHGRYARHNIVCHSTDQEAVERVAAQSDVLVTWGTAAYVNFIPPSFTGPLVVVAQGCCRWTADVVTASLPVTSHYVAVSQAALATWPLAVRHECRVIHNPVEFDRITPSRSRDTVRAELGLSPGQHAIGFVGRLAREKNPGLVERVARLVHRGVPVFVGSSWAMTGFEFEPAKPSACRFVDPPDCIGDYYGALDCLVMPSPSEGFSLAIAEAWAAGLPVAATPVGGIPEVEARVGPVVERINLTDPDEVTAAKITTLLSKGRDSEVTRRARQFAWEELSAAAHGRKWSEFLREVCDA
jgi:glycosyltransferase involved in cell wall biosynthesis